jgi:hypothetical protein
MQQFQIDMADQIFSHFQQPTFQFIFKYNQQDATLYAATNSVGEFFQLTHTSSSRKQALHIPDAVCTVLSS